MEQETKKRGASHELEKLMKPIIADLIANKQTPGQIGLEHGMSLQVIRRNLEKLDQGHLLVTKKPRADKSKRKIEQEMEQKKSLVVLERYFMGESIAQICETQQEHETKVRRRIASALPETWLGV